MILKFDEIPVSVLPQFKGGEKELAANMFFAAQTGYSRAVWLRGHQSACIPTKTAAKLFSS